MEKAITLLDVIKPHNEGESLKGIDESIAKMVGEKYTADFKKYIQENYSP